jgi:intracellular multiplication protein IcmT
MQNDLGSHWRDSARQPKLFIIDAKAALFVLFWLLHPRWWTFYVALGFIILVTILDYFKLTLPVAMRLLRRAIGGKKKIRLLRASV